MRILLLALVISCGGKSAPAPAKEQSLTEGVTILCDSPTRAEADPRWKDEGAMKPSILGEHLTEGVTNARVTAWVDGLKDKDNVGKHDELKALVAEAGVGKCRLLAEVWSCPDGTAPDKEKGCEGHM